MSNQLTTLTHAQRIEIFGEFKFTPNPTFGNPEGIRIDRDWVAGNIRSFEVPQLAKLDPNARITHPINMHYRAEKPMLELWREWERLGLLEVVQTWNGSWVPRLKRGFVRPNPESLSNHAWGTAFDINARLYPLGKPVSPLSRMWELARVAEQFGFAWGGNFKRRPDPMHFELVVVPAEAES